MTQSNKKGAPAPAKTPQETTDNSSSSNFIMLPDYFKPVKAFSSDGLTLVGWSEHTRYLHPAEIGYCALHPVDVELMAPGSEPVFECADFVLFAEPISGGLGAVKTTIEWEEQDWAEFAMTEFLCKDSTKIRKNISLDANLDLKKTGMERFFNGSCKTQGSVTVPKLYRYLRNPAKKDFAFFTAGCYLNPADADEKGVVRMGALGAKKARHRSLENFPMPSGPAALIIDSDEIAYWPQLRTPADVVQAIGLNTDCVTSTSASSNLVWPNGSTALKGLHTFFPIDCGDKIPEILYTLHKRCWLKGFGRILVGSNGVLHERSLVDRTLQSGNQPIFEHGAVLRDDRITQNRQVHIHRGDHRMVEAADTKPLSAAEESEYKRLVADAKGKREGEAAGATEEWIARQLTKVPEGDREVARAKLLELRETKHRDLPPYFELQRNDGSRFTVADILADPNAWHYKSLCDPFEPEYGPAKATVFSKDQRDGRVRIVSMAHGSSVVYFLDKRPKASRGEGVAPGCLLWVAETAKGVKRGRLVDSLARDVMVRHLDGAFAWSPEAKSWHTWTGCYWKPEENFSAVEKRVHDIAEVGCSDLGFTATYVAAIERLLRMGASLPLPDYDDKAYVPFENGLLDIATKELVPVSPSFAGTWCLPYQYTPSADCPSIRAWMLSAMNGDHEMVEYLRAVLAAALMGRYDLHCFFYLKGDGGSGKSTFIRLAKALVGNDNCHTTDLKNLEESRFETSCLYGKRLAIVNDADKYGGGVANFKAMTGGDSLRNERKNVQQSAGSSFVFEGVVLLASNVDLVTSDMTSGLIRRQRNIEFTKVVSEAEKAAWRARGGEEAVIHSELPGLVNWLLELGPEQVAEIINNPPMRAVRSNFDAMLANNRVARWLVEWCVPAPGVHTAIGKSRPLRDPGTGEVSYANQDCHLYPNFLAFCSAESVKSMSLDRFISIVEDITKALHHPVLRKRMPGKNVDSFRDIALRNVEDDRFAWSKCLGSEELAGQIIDIDGFTD